jgi:hypothetical protein
MVPQLYRRNRFVLFTKSRNLSVILRCREQPPKQQTPLQLKEERELKEQQLLLLGHAGGHPLRRVRAAAVFCVVVVLVVIFAGPVGPILAFLAPAAVSHYSCRFRGRTQTTTSTSRTTITCRKKALTTPPPRM